MAGSAQQAQAQAQVLAYLGRLTGATPSLEEPLALRSVHRAALGSWARKQGVPLRLAVLTSGSPFYVRDLLEEPEAGTLDLAGSVGATADASPRPPAGSRQSGSTGHRTSGAGVEVSAGIGSESSAGAAFGALAGIGIDIEEVENLPEAADYREDAFFAENFTPAEIAYCIRQGDVRASFCGLWAAKEAIFKAGLGPGGAAGFGAAGARQAGARQIASLRSIVIERDEAGRPVYPGCQLSISHTAKTAVAICLVAAPAPAVPTIASGRSVSADPEPGVAQARATQSAGPAANDPAANGSSLHTAPAAAGSGPDPAEGGPSRRWPWSRRQQS